MSVLYLFRLKAVDESQGALFQERGSRREFLSKLLLSRPSAELREGYIWHIGNVKSVGEDGLVFAVGRTTKTSKEQYDDTTGNFVEVDDVESPFTFAYYDRHFSVIGISPRSRLSPTVKGIARNLEKLLNQQPLTHDHGVRVECSEIWDPESFLAQVRAAYAVVGFTVEFTGPNPFDVEEEFHKPMERYLESTGGEKGRTTVLGRDLDKDTVEQMTRSVASTGNDATARLRKARGQRPVTRHLRGDPVSIQFDDDEASEAGGLLQRLREAYQRVRQRGAE